MEIAVRYTRGGIVLFAGNVTQALAAAIAAFLVYRLLGPGNSGLLALAIVPANILQLFIGFGVTIAITRDVAFCTSQGEAATAVRIARNGIVFTLLTGVALAAVVFFASGPVSASLLHRPELSQYVGIASLVVLGQSLLQACVAAAIGWGSMGIASISAAAQGVARMVVSPLLVVAGFGIGGAVVGYSASFVFAGAVSLALLFNAALRKPRDHSKSFAADVFEMIRFGFPPYVGGVLSGLAVFYVPLVLAGFASNETIGYYTAANTLTVPITLVSGTVAAALFPAFAGIDGLGGDLSGAFKRATQYVGYISVPIVFVLAAAAGQFMEVLYGPLYLPGTDYLILLSFASLPVVAGLGILPAFFNGIGRTRMTLLMVGTATLTIFVLAPLLGETAALGVDGVILAVLLSNVVLTAVGLGFVRRVFSATVRLRPLLATLCSGLIAFLLAYPIPAFSSSLLVLLLKLVVFGVVYLTLGPALGAVDVRDLVLVRGAVGQMKVVGPLLGPFFQYQEFVASRTRGSDGLPR